MKLVDVTEDYNAFNVLYDLLAERPPEANISHRKMPSWAKHVAFVRSNPYLAWYIIKIGVQGVGTVYLSKDREIGIAVLKKHQGNGYATKAIGMVRKKFPGKIYANVAPHNGKSIQLFTKLGFRPFQYVYVKE